MFKSRTLKILAAMIALLALLALPALIWPDYFESTFGAMAAIPYLSIYLFHKIGVPGLLRSQGACGWGWCAPTVFGIVFICAFWFFVVWLLAWGVAQMTGCRDS